MGRCLARCVMSRSRPESPWDTHRLRGIDNTRYFALEVVHVGADVLAVVVVHGARQQNTRKSAREYGASEGHQGKQVHEFVGSFESGYHEDDTNVAAWPIPNVVGIVRKP